MIIESLAKYLGRVPTLEDALAVYHNGQVKMFDSLGNVVISEVQLISLDVGNIQVRLANNDSQLLTSSPSTSSNKNCQICNNSVTTTKLTTGKDILYCPKCHHTDWLTTNISVNNETTRRGVSLSCDNGICRLIEG